MVHKNQLRWRSGVFKTIMYWRGCHNRQHVPISINRVYWIVSNQRDEIYTRTGKQNSRRNQKALAPD